MKRTKAWWARLEPEERSYLVYLERMQNRCSIGSAYYPDDVGDCPACGCPTISSGMCRHCRADMWKLIEKASGKNPEEDLANAQIYLACKEIRNGQS